MEVVVDLRNVKRRTEKKVIETRDEKNRGKGGRRKRKKRSIPHDSDHRLAESNVDPTEITGEQVGG